MSRAVDERDQHARGLRASFLLGHSGKTPGTYGGYPPGLLERGLNAEVWHFCNALERTSGLRQCVTLETARGIGSFFAAQGGHLEDERWASEEFKGGNHPLPGWSRVPAMLSYLQPKVVFAKAQLAHNAPVPCVARNCHWATGGHRNHRICRWAFTEWPSLRPQAAASRNWLFSWQS